MISPDKRLRLCKVCLLCILAFIWGNSLLPGDVSAAFSDWVKSLLEALLPGGGNPREGRGLLRKIAHFTEFAALGMTLGWLGSMLQKKRHWPLLLGMAAACIDETIQRFVPGRGPSLRDVAIDSCGVLTGLVLLHLGHTYWKKHQHKHRRITR